MFNSRERNKNLFLDEYKMQLKRNNSKGNKMMTFFIKSLLSVCNALIITFRSFGLLELLFVRFTEKEFFQTILP